jgi:hypothetical protein
LDWWTRAGLFATVDIGVLGVIGGFFGSCLTDNQKIAIVIAGFGLILPAFLLSWSAKPNDTKQDVWKAIKTWVELPIVEFDDKRDELPLAESPPELATAIEECLSRRYPSLWADLQKFRQEYSGWKNVDSSAKFMRVVDGRTIINLDDVIKWDEFKRRELMRMHSRLAEQIKSEILDKHHTQLKC